MITNADTGARLDQNKACGLFLTKNALVKSKRKNPGKKRKDSQTSALCGISYASTSDKQAQMETSASNRTNAKKCSEQKHSLKQKAGWKVKYIKLLQNSSK